MIKPPIVKKFIILSFLCVVVQALVMGFTISFLLSRHASEWEWENTAVLVRHQVELAGLEALFTAPQSPETRERWRKELSRLFAGLPDVMRVKVWDREGTVLWSDEAQLIGQRFPDNRDLRAALAGEVNAEIRELTKPEHAYEEGRYSMMAEVYIPIFAKGSEEVLGVLEIYKSPARLFATILRAQIVVWTIALAGGLALCLVLFLLLRQLYGREPESTQ